MKIITRDTDYAIRALCYLAKHGKKFISCKELVSCLKVPRPFLRKILQKISKKHFVRSVKGKGGGFLLERPADKIFIIDLIKVFQGPVKIAEHIFKKNICPHIKTCVLKRKLDRIEELVIKELKAITIASLIEDIS